MNRKKFIKEMAAYGLLSEKNKKEVINTASLIISILNNTETNKKLSDADIDKICGGLSQSHDIGHHCA